MQPVPTLIFHRVNTIPKYFDSVLESTERKIEDRVSSSDNVKFFSNKYLFSFYLIFNRTYICNFKTQCFDGVSKFLSVAISFSITCSNFTDS